jgi:RecA-family ATPase
VEKINRRGITGSELRYEIHETPPERLPLIEGLLYEKSVLMTTADPAIGKSTIMACAIAQMSAGLPVFGYLNVPRPLKCYYVPFERGRHEIEERLRILETVIPINYNYIVINDNFIGMDVTNPDHADEIIETIRQDIPFGLDVFLGDPMYACVRGGLSSDEKASQVTNFSARIIKEFGCSNWWNHHNVKDSYGSDGKKINKTDPFYGSIWLKAHATAAYYMGRSETGGTVLEQKKDSIGSCLEKIILDYDEDTHISRAVNLQESSVIKDRAMLFLRRCFHQKTTFTFKQFLAQLGGVQSGVSVSYARSLLSTPPAVDNVTKVISSGHATLYKVEHLF